MRVDSQAPSWSTTLEMDVRLGVVDHDAEYTDVTPKNPQPEDALTGQHERT
jgi:hypothetical protein